MSPGGCSASQQDAGMAEQDLQQHADTGLESSAWTIKEQQSKHGVQRLPMNHELFAEGNLRRELLAQQTAVSRGDEPLSQSSSSESEAMRVLR